MTQNHMPAKHKTKQFILLACTVAPAVYFLLVIVDFFLSGNFKWYLDEPLLLLFPLIIGLLFGLVALVYLNLPQRIRNTLNCLFGPLATTFAAIFCGYQSFQILWLIEQFRELNAPQTGLYPILVVLLLLTAIFITLSAILWRGYYLSYINIKQFGEKNEAVDRIR